MEPVEKREYNTEQRRQMADEGKALPDGSFPIADKTDLGNALQSIGRAKNRSLAMAHIRRRAKDLDAMDMLPEWAMAKGVSTPLSVALGVLLADTYSVYHEAHGFHWNVRGADFSQYHDLFAEISDDIYGSVDPIAENMLKINADAPFRMNELATMRTIPESAPATDPQSMAEALLKQVEGLLNTLVRTFDVANNQNEQGIANFLAERIDMTQKWAWQLRASTGMQKADRIALERLYPTADATPAEWDLLVKAVIQSGGIRNLSGYAKDVLEKAAKQSFGGNRSAAGRYAAQVRWGNRGGGASAGAATAGGSSSEGPSMAVGSMKDQIDADYEAAMKPKAPAQAGGGMTRNQAYALDRERSLGEMEANVSRAYERTGFGGETGEALGAINNTRQMFLNAQASLRAGRPAKEVAATLKKESTRLKSASTRTRKKADTMLAEEGGVKRDANGKLILQRSNRVRTDAQVFANLATMLANVADELA